MSAIEAELAAIYSWADAELAAGAAASRAFGPGGAAAFYAVQRYVMAEIVRRAMPLIRAEWHRIWRDAFSGTTTRTPVPHSDDHVSAAVRERATKIAADLGMTYDQFADEAHAYGYTVSEAVDQLTTRGWPSLP